MTKINFPYETQLDAVFSDLKKELTKIRTGRAHISLIADIPVDAYGVSSPLTQLATITTPEPRVLLVQPYDQNIVKNIETAIRKRGQDLNPIVDEKTIRIPIPQLTEERRKEFVKLIHNKAEECRRAMRQIRDHEREKIQNQEKEKQVTKDDKFALFKEVDENVRAAALNVETMVKEKETEIMTL